MKYFAVTNNLSHLSESKEIAPIIPLSVTPLFTSKTSHHLLITSLMEVVQYQVWYQLLLRKLYTIFWNSADIRPAAFDNTSSWPYCGWYVDTKL